MMDRAESVSGQLVPGAWQLIHGDCIDALAAMPEASVDAVVCDPPYGLGFMGKEWDSPGGTGDFPMRRTDATNTVNTGASRQGGRQRSTEDFAKRQARDARSYQEWCEAWARECLRVLKPGGHLLAMGGTRTYHRLAAGIEDAGFEIRDTIAWLYGSGFPKSRNLDGDWKGWGTALKPAHEPCVVARKSLVGTVAANVALHGTGAVNIDGCRVGDTVETWPASRSYAPGQMQPGHSGATQSTGAVPAGRWPANIVLDPESAALLDEQTGELTSGYMKPTHTDAQCAVFGQNAEGGYTTMETYGDQGGASRFFYVAKPDTEERNRGLEGFTVRPVGGQLGQQDGKRMGRSAEEGANVRESMSRNPHPTVKPVELMRWLVRLVTPPSGTVLDPFTGSGTTGIAALREGFAFVGIEQDADYIAVARARIIGDAPLLNGMTELVPATEGQAA